MRTNTYKPIQQIRDVQPIRATCFHPSGEAYVVGTNSKALRFCKYPSLEEQRKLWDCDKFLTEPEISFTCLHIHCASVYCASFNPKGTLLATGSNDQVVHVIRYNPIRHAPEGSEYKLSMHNGTVRDVCFLHGDGQSGESNLLSAGAGDYSIHLTDCDVMKPIQMFTGHESTVMSLTSCESSPNLFVSGCLDGSIRLWDVRSLDAVQILSGKGQRQHLVDRQPIKTTDGDTSFDFPRPDENLLQRIHPEITNDDEHHNGASNSDQQSPNVALGSPKGLNLGRSEAKSSPTSVPVGVVRLDSSGRLLISGHQDGTCMLHDVRGGRVIQVFQAHSNEIRTLSLSPSNYYLLTGSYDGSVKLIDLQGRLTQPLPNIEAAYNHDKVIQVAWHPTDYNFVTTCADGTATLWTIPDFDDWRDSIVMDTSVMI